jgi:proton glutamate symport protein
LFSIGIQLAKEQAKPFIELVESIYIISEKILSVILYIAPFGVFALMSSVIATQGLGLIARLFLYVLGLFIASTIMIGFYTGVLFILKAEPTKFFSSLAQSLSLAFGTASSNAALPVVLQNVQDNYGLREDIASFAIPLGTALKRDGSAILQGFNAIFIAQIYHIPLTPSLLLAIALSSLLVSFSTPGVPGSALITMTTVLTAAGLPLEGIAIVAGVDRLTDGFKTVLNVIGNTVNAILLSYWEADEPAELPVYEQSS